MAQPRKRSLTTGLARRQVHQLGQPRPVTVGGAEGQLVALGPLEVQVRWILPGHPDAAMQLYALLRGVHGDAAAVSLSDRRGDGRIRVAQRARAGGVAGRRPGRTDLKPQISQPVFDRLVGADRAAELLALLGVS